MALHTNTYMLCLAGDPFIKTEYNSLIRTVRSPWKSKNEILVS